VNWRKKWWLYICIFFSGLVSSLEKGVQRKGEGGLERKSGKKRKSTLFSKGICEKLNLIYFPIGVIGGKNGAVYVPFFGLILWQKRSPEKRGGGN